MTVTARPAPHTIGRHVAARWHVVRVRGRVVGIVRPWGAPRQLCLVKVVSGSRHQHQNPPAWALAVEALEAARIAGASKIVVVDRIARLEWWAWIGDFERRGVQLERGFGPQVALGLGEWSRRPLRAEELEAMERPRR